MSTPRCTNRARSFACLGLAISALLAWQQPPSAPSAPAYTEHERLMVVCTDKGSETAIRSVADWEVRRAHILAHVQDVMGALPGGERRVTLDVTVVEEHDEPLYTRRKITFAAEPGDRVSAWLLIPKNSARKLPGVLCLHQTTAIGKDEPAGLGGNPNLHYAKELADRGYGTLAPDYPNFGEYHCDPYALGYASASMKGIWNHMRALDLLSSLPEVDAERLGVIGHSLGGHNAVFVGLFDPRIKAVVSSCGFNAFPYYFEGKIAGWSHNGYMPRLKSVYELNLAKVPFDFPELIGALAPRGVFVSAPLHDSNFDVKGVDVCLEAARPVFELHKSSGRLRAVQPDSAHDFPASARQEAYAFLDSILKP